MRFDELALSDEILDALDSMGFKECTPVQEQAIGVVLAGYDLIACAQTGTGKTAAYLLPVIDLLADYGGKDKKVKCVIMVPTHELAQQIDRQMEGFSYFLPVSSLAIHGGNDGKAFAQQQHALRAGADMVIATPGRLLAHMKMGYVDLSGVEFFVLDEADRMLDMGFYDDIMRIVRELPSDRQTLMFSATMPAQIRKMANDILYQPKEIKIAISKPAEKVQQSVYICHEYQKTDLLKKIFKDGFNKKVIVFAGSKQKVRELTQSLRRERWKAAEMHSDLDQAAREKVIHDFRNGRIDILIATDILSRGIDIDDITMVVNYDVPGEAEDYVHRIGRTARAGSDGRAVTFVSERDQPRFARIERFLDIEVPREAVPAEFGDAPEYKPQRQSSGRRGSHGRKPSGRKPQGKPKAEQGADRVAGDNKSDNKADKGSQSKKRYNHRRNKPAKESKQS